MEKVQNYQNWTFEIILDHLGRKRWIKMQNDQNWTFQIILGHFGRKRWEKDWGTSQKMVTQSTSWCF